MEHAETPPSDILWDAIIVGAGMGGATLGYALAHAGKRVLFIEKGPSLFAGGDAIRGQTPEEVCDLTRLAEPERNRMLARAGRSCDAVTDESGPKRRQFVPELGNGGGGSTALFGMVLERMFPADFTPRRHHADAVESTLPESWPIAYEDLAPCYAEAERLFRVRGAADPLRHDDDAANLRSPAPMSPANAQLADFLRERGLHPYPLHLACELHPGCETCQGYLCHRECKNDAGRMCLAPAVGQHGAVLLDECTVLRLEAGGTSVERVVCVRHGQEFALRGKFVALAAGALATPALLLRSKSERWPQGLANERDLVGRNLMRHGIDMIVLRPKKLAEPITGHTKELAFNDYYLRDGVKWGTVQSIGGIPPFLHYVGKMGPDMRFMRYLRFALGPFWEWQRKRVIVLASILEDLPYADNRVLPGEEPATEGRQAMQLQYHMREREVARAKAFNQELQTLFKPYRAFCLSVAHDNKVVGHVCGTCRFGDDPAHSVLDRDCRAHGLDNLYVVDASFFPSSAGINPSLTIAANALRVARHLLDRL